METKEVTKFKCGTCDVEYTADDFLFQSLVNPNRCPDCDRDEYNQALSD